MKKLKTGSLKAKKIPQKSPKKIQTVGKTSRKRVFFFGNGKAEGEGSQKQLLGGKGANLHEMTRLGLRVPAGFTISTEVCTYFYQNQERFPQGFEQEVTTALQKIEKVTGRRLGARTRPLLVSVRSGAAASMPGMMDTILNLGINDDSVQGWTEESQDNARFSYDSYRRFVAMYGEVVLGVAAPLFESALEDLKHQHHCLEDHQLSAEQLAQLVKKFKQIIAAEGQVFPEDPHEQLWGAIRAVLHSWMNSRAITYRALQGIPESGGTAVTIQAMVFGNRGEDCATGVAFTRDPSTGEKKFFGEFLLNAQGEDVVAGIRTPQAINLASKQASDSQKTLEELMPEVYQQLVKVYQTLEQHYRDMQDIEFTIEQGKLYLLQTRSGKRSAAAALRIAIDLVNEHQITQAEAILRIQPEQLDQLLHPRLDPQAHKQFVTQGLPASPGAASGQIVFDPETAALWAEQGKKVLLVRAETSPEDIKGMAAAQGILTARGGMTSHAAVVARGMGKPCVSGCVSLKISEWRKECTVDHYVFREGDLLTIDGSTGEVFLGLVPTLSANLNADLETLLGWADQYRRLQVFANADTPLDAQTARSFGAEGIGLCRTEHMFFDADRIDAVREMIFAMTSSDRALALEKMLPMQKSDFKALFQAMPGKPVIIRLLDPPLHEFVPHEDREIRVLAEKLQISFDQLKSRRDSLHEMNPMLGHRGCRLGISYPEIYQTQVRAIMEAACEVMLEQKARIVPEIMIPLIGHWQELRFLREKCELEVQAAFAKYHLKPTPVLIGTMIELPRAALTSEKIAGFADFFSFGTNDLTQTTLGLSRDDAGAFLKDYLRTKVYDADPFASIDPEGVGRLMKLSIQEGRLAKPDLKIGICGEQGGDPSSIVLCHQLGLNYVSCSPYRVAIARLAAAQAHLRYPTGPEAKVASTAATKAKASTLATKRSRATQPQPEPRKAKKPLAKKTRAKNQSKAKPTAKRGKVRK